MIAVGYKFLILNLKKIILKNAKFEEADEIEKDLQKLKYVSLKNLSLIQNEHTQNFKFALEYLIQV